MGTHGQEKDQHKRKLTAEYLELYGVHGCSLDSVGDIVTTMRRGRNNLRVLLICKVSHTRATRQAVEPFSMNGMDRGTASLLY